MLSPATGAAWLRPPCRAWMVASSWLVEVEALMVGVVMVEENVQHFYLSHPLKVDSQIFKQLVSKHIGQ
jgi:hypothetical protein